MDIKKNLATIEYISRVMPHPSADRLDLVTVLGYQCVVPKGLYKEKDIVVYIKPDTVLPDLPWAEVFKKYAPKRVKAIQLRGEWSEGVVISTNDVVELLNDIDLSEIQFGYCVTERLGVTKYELPLPQDLNAKKSILPYDIGKTDENRFENMLSKLPYGELVDVTLKVDGSSTTYGYKLDEDSFFVTSRTQELYKEFSNNYTLPLKKYNIEEKLKEYCKKYNISLALRGEVYGQGIQNSKNNPHSKLEKDIAFFSTYLIDERRYARKGDQHYFLNICKELGLPTVSILEENVRLTEELIAYYSTGIETITNGDLFEGVVIQYSRGSFKVMNKYYDSKK